MIEIKSMKIALFSDGADLVEMSKMRGNSLVKGFTTNPTLMRAAGVKDYIEFARRARELVFPLPISLEVFEDNFTGMARQARLLSSLGENVFVKIPVTNTEGLPSYNLISQLNSEGVKLNITAVFTEIQAKNITHGLTHKVESIISVFAGRIADSGRDPVPTMMNIRALLEKKNHIKLLWASPREILNVIQAEQSGCDIITMTSDLWRKLPTIGKNLDEFSKETVKMFYEDAVNSGYTI